MQGMGLPLCHHKKVKFHKELNFYEFGKETRFTNAKLKLCNESNRMCSEFIK